MKFSHFILTVILAIATYVNLTIVASADNRYWGFDYSMVDIDVEQAGSFDTGTVQGVLGIYVNDLVGTSFPIAVEGRAGLGITDDSSDGVTVETDHYIGLYVRGELIVSERFVPYGILGWTRIEATAKGFGESVSESDSDISFGVGARYQYNQHIAFNLEYLSQMVDDVSALSFGVRYAW